MRDTEAVASIVAGDPDGLATAYDRYADPLFTYCQSLLGGTAEAADAVQDTFVIAAARLGQLDDPQRLRAWLFAVARRECLRVLRSKTRTQPPREAGDVTGSAEATGPADDTAPAGEADGPGNAETAGGGDAEAGRAGLRTLFEHACAGLGPGEREVIELELRQGLEPGEAATVLGVSRSRAHALAARARDELETCLGVLLVGRAGRDECAGLGSLLAGWDGRLTATLSKRVGRHIEHCSACSARRAVELRPSAMLDLTPAAALAAGAAESFRQAAGAPAALKAHTIALATAGGPASAAHATAVLTRAGRFGKQGFPKPARGAIGSGAAGWSRPSVRSTPRGQAAVAAGVVLAVGVAAAGFALSNGREHLTPVADPKPAVSPAATSTATANTAATARTTTRAAGRSPKARATTPVAVTVTRAAVTTTAAAPTTAAPSRSPSAAPSVTQSPAPTAPGSQPAGTLRVFPGGGSLFLAPGGRGALIFLRASGGTVNWSVSVSGDPDGTISVSPGTSGTLTAAQPHVILTITASQNLSCGNGGTPCPTITIEPGGAVLTVTTQGRRHPFKRHRRH